MLTPDDVRNILSDLPEDLAKRVEDLLICISVAWDPLRRRVPVCPKSYPGRYGGAIYLHASAGRLETGDFIPVDSTVADVICLVESSVMAIERGLARQAAPETPIASGQGSDIVQPKEADHDDNGDDRDEASTAGGEGDGGGKQTSGVEGAG